VYFEALSGTKESIVMEKEIVLRTEGLSKRFGKRVAVDNLPLEVYRGDVFGLLGPNGSGKTTTIRMILNLIRPTNGRVILFGCPSTEKGAYREALRGVGAIVEQPLFYPFLSGWENLRGIAVFAGLPDNSQTRTRIDEVLQMVGLAERARDTFQKYSLGMKQRLGIAAALLNNPELVILDEPTNGLDPAGVVEIRNFIGLLAKQGITVIVSSHILHEIQQVCSRVAIIKFGQLLVQGDVHSLLASQSGVRMLFRSTEQAYMAEKLLNALRGERAPWLNGAHCLQAEAGSWAPPGSVLLHVDVSVEHSADLNAYLCSQGVVPAEIRRVEASLERYFLELTGEAAGSMTNHIQGASMMAPGRNG